MYKSFFKPFLDFIIALLALAILSPILIVITIALYIANSGKPFFIQSRPGLNEKIFKIIKFKTMNDKKDENGILLADNDRITAIGKFVRSTSLDEIPQLINVLIGDMSLIGPRPLLEQYLPLYNEFQKKRHNVRPGITGWAQINGRNAIGWVEKFKLDVYYVEHVSPLLDIQIVYLTFVKVFKRESVNSTNDITMEAFTGKN